MKISGPCNISRKARTYLKVKFFRSLSHKTYLAMFWLELGSLVAAMGRCGVGVVRQLLPRQVGERGGHSGAGGTTLHRQLHASSSKPRLRNWPSYLCKGETGVQGCKTGRICSCFFGLELWNWVAGEKAWWNAKAGGSVLYLRQASEAASCCWDTCNLLTNTLMVAIQRFGKIIFSNKNYSFKFQSVRQIGGPLMFLSGQYLLTA